MHFHVFLANLNYGSCTKQPTAGHLTSITSVGPLLFMSSEEFGFILGIILYSQWETESINRNL